MAVYFIQAGENGPIKIGYSEKVASRLVKMQVDNPARLAVLAVIDDGDVEVEGGFHVRFSAHALGGEWFAPAKDLLDLIETLPKFVRVRKSKFVPKANPQNIFEAFGSVSKLAKALGHKNVTTVDGWKRSGKIPGWRKNEIIAAANREGVDLPAGFNSSEAA
jgi:hypothetical protein